MQQICFMAAILFCPEIFLDSDSNAKLQREDMYYQFKL